MESAKTQVTKATTLTSEYIWYSTITTVDRDNSGEYYFVCESARFWVGRSPPDLFPGDQVKITIRKHHAHISSP
jgi:hypothetical protein